jgi:hypothetical protein
MKNLYTYNSLDFIALSIARIEKRNSSIHAKDVVASMTSAQKQVFYERFEAHRRNQNLIPDK